MTKIHPAFEPAKRTSVCIPTPRNSPNYHIRKVKDFCPKGRETRRPCLAWRPFAETCRIGCRGHVSEMRGPATGKAKQDSNFLLWLTDFVEWCGREDSNLHGLPR